MAKVTESLNSIHQFVTWLRDQSIRLDTPELMEQTKQVLEEAGVGIGVQDDSKDRYARALRSLLSCEILPEKFSVTNGVSVPFYNIGDAVDGQYQIGNTRCWYYGVVVASKKANAARSYEVFSVGFPPTRSGVKNPMWMSVHSLRSHVEGTMAGTVEDWLDVEKIRRKYPPDRCDPPSVVEIPSDACPSAVASAAADTNAETSSDSMRPTTDRVDTQSPSGGQGEGRPKREIKRPRSDSTEADGGGGHVRTPRPVSKPRPAVIAPGKQQSTLSTLADQNSSPPAKKQSTLGSQNSFEIADSVKFAIDCLESLDRGEIEHPETWSGLVKRIKSIAASLASIYCNKSYNTMVSETLAELEGYAGPEAPRLPHSKIFLSLLAKHGFCITPRMYSKCEILCIGIVMLDSQHHYVRIQQKAGNKKGGDGFRGMALLDPRVNRVMYNRLKRYGFANPRFHPTALHPFSSVVINGGGCWLQSSDWDFTLQSRFRVNPEAIPFAFVVSKTPGVLEANGLYVATTLERNSHSVYVQVSAIEFSGPPKTAKKG